MAWALRSTLLVWALLAIPVRADSMSDLKAELAQLASEQASIEREIADLQRDYGAAGTDAERLTQWHARLVRERDAGEAQRPAIEQLCRQNVPQRELAAAQARCEAARTPFLEEVRRFNAELVRLGSEIDAFRARDRQWTAQIDQKRARTEALAEHARAIEQQIVAAPKLLNASAGADDAAPVANVIVQGQAPQQARDDTASTTPAAIDQAVNPAAGRE